MGQKLANDDGWKFLVDGLEKKARPVGRIRRQMGGYERVYGVRSMDSSMVDAGQLAWNFGDYRMCE